MSRHEPGIIDTWEASVHWCETRFDFNERTGLEPLLTRRLIDLRPIPSVPSWSQFATSKWGDMPKTNAIVPLERIESRILLIRGHEVMLDSDLAELYGVTTKRLNEQVKANFDITAVHNHILDETPHSILFV